MTTEVVAGAVQPAQNAAPLPSRWAFFCWGTLPVWGLLGAGLLAAVLVVPTLWQADQAVQIVIAEVLAVLLYFGLFLWLSRSYRHWLPGARLPRSGRWRLFAVLGCWAAVMLVGLFSVLSGLTDLEAYEQYTSEFAQRLSVWPTWLLWLTLVVIGPAAEELAFRRWMLSVLPKAVGSVLAVPASVLLFVLMHFPSFLGQFIALLALSLATTWIWFKTHDWRMCWAVHALNNAVFVLGLSL